MVTLTVPRTAMSAMGTVTASCVPVCEPAIGVSVSAPNWTTLALFKPVPVKVSVNGGPPRPADEGLRLVSVGSGLVTVNVRALDAPPPGVELFTVTVIAPGLAMSAARTLTVSCVALCEPATGFSMSAPKWTVLPATKPEPVMTSGKPTPPATAEFGLSALICGVGFVMLNRSELD